jgi:oligosaccharide repeat unit polymerase
MQHNYLLIPRNRSLLAIALFAFLMAAFLALATWVQSAGLYVAITIAAVMLIVCIWIVYARVRTLGTMIDGYVLIWISFTIVYPLSAMVHLIGAEGQRRGFYDLVRADYLPNLENIYYSLFLTFVAFVALWVSLKSSKSAVKKSPSHLVVHVPSLLVLGVLFTVFGIIGTLELFTGYPSLTQGLLVVDRSREIGGGLARYVFMSQWLSWGLIFLMVFFLKTDLGKSKLTVISFVVPFAVLIVINIFWTGGRASAIVALIPGLFLLQRIRAKYSTSAVIFVGFLILGYFVIVTLMRNVSSSALSSDELLIDVLDWHVGRFSMIGLGVEMVNRYGVAWGSTLFEGLADTINAPLILLKLPQIVETPQGITSVVGMYLVKNPQMTGIVPGTICELYYNFGLFGVVGGYFLIGTLLQKCIKVIQNTKSMGVFTLAVYLIVLICSSFIPGTFTSWVYYLATIGFPVICLFICELILKNGIYGHKYIFKYKRIQST